MIFESVSLTIVSKVLDSDVSAVGNGTVLIVGSLQSAMLWLSVISLVFNLYHCWVSGSQHNMQIVFGILGCKSS